MNKKQEDKLEYGYLFYSDKDLREGEKSVFRAGYEACLESNGIGEETQEPSEHGAPEWVIDMIRSGKPVRCKVWDDDEKTSEIAMIDCYCMCNGGGEFRYSDVMGEPWKHAEPIPAWEPKDGEAVFARHGAGYIVGRVERVIMDVAHIHDTEGRTFTYNVHDLKPFDASKIGKPWSEL